MEAEGHQIIHQVIAVGDLMEDFVDEPLLFVQSNGPLTEMGMLGSCTHERFSADAERN